MRKSKLLLYITLGKLGGLQLEDFDHRLILQKRVYLIQSLGFNLNYSYNWYVRGPYSPQLTEEAFALQNELSTVRTESQDYSLTADSVELIEKYQVFESKSEGVPLPLFLELAASIHYLRNRGFSPGGKERLDIASALRQREKEFTDEQFQTAWDALSESELL